MRRALLATLASAVVVTLAACTSDAPTSPEDGLLGKRAPTSCLTGEQLALSDSIRVEIALLFDKKAQNPATQQINNIERKVCEGNFAAALDMAWGFLSFIDGQLAGASPGDAAAAGKLASDVFELASDPDATTDAFMIPGGAFLPTGGIVTFNPADASSGNPIVAGTQNGEAAIVIDNPNAFPPGTGLVTIALSRSSGDLVTTPGAYIPGFRAYEEGYEIVSSAQPSDTGGGVIVALCIVPPAPSNVVIGHLHESEVTLLVATVPDPDSLGYIDCSDVDPTTSGEEGPVLSLNADRPLLNFAQRLLRPVGKLLSPPPLEANMLLAAGRGLGGRTTSLSLNAPVDPTIPVGDSVQLTVATTATWSTDNTGVATVDGTGLVTGVGPGTANITAVFGSQSLTTLVTVEGEVTPQGPQIVFTSFRDGNNEVYAMNLDGSAQRNLSSSAAFDYGPSWSPDGSRIAFSSDVGGDFRIYTMDPDGTGRSGPLGVSRSFWPSWSPDGSAIAYWSAGQIHTMNADGTNDVTLPTVTTSGVGNAVLMDWSPDGTVIVTGMEDGVGGRSLVLINADGTGSATTLTSGFTDLSPAWSPDGTRIAFARSGAAQEIFLMNADGTNVTQLTTTGATNEDPNWSSDGSQIVLSSNRTGGRFIHVMNADGTGLTVLTAVGPDVDPEFQPQPQPPVIQ